MALIKPQKFIVESFKEQASWISSLLNPLNFMFDDLTSAFQNNLTISENFYQEIKEINFKNQTSSFPLKFKTKFNVNPKGLLNIYLWDNTLGKNAALSPVIDWSFGNNEISIKSISGLTASTNYTLRLLIIYG